MKISHVALHVLEERAGALIYRLTGYLSDNSFMENKHNSSMHRH